MTFRGFGLRPGKSTGFLCRWGPGMYRRGVALVGRYGLVYFGACRAKGCHLERIGSIGAAKGSFVAE